MNSSLRRLIISSFLTASLAACATTSKSVVLPTLVTTFEPSPPKPIIKDGLFIGPGTAQTYAPEVFDALRRHASQPIAVLSGDDYLLLKHKDNDFEAAQELKAWLPAKFAISEFALSVVIKAMKDGADDTTIPVYPAGRGRRPPVAGVIVIPGSNFGADYFRGQSNLNFQDGIFTQSLLREASLFIAAHEASHVKLMARHLNSEMGAEMGAYAFISENPDLFPVFRNRSVSEAFLAGERAFWTLLTSGQGSYATDTNTDYMMIPFCSAQMRNCASTASRSRLDGAQADLMRKVAAALFPAMSDAETARQYLQRRLRATATSTICMNGKSICESPKNMTEPSNHLVVQVINVIRRLRSAGSFNDNTDEQVFVAHLLAGADLYLGPSHIMPASNRPAVRYPRPALLRAEPGL